MQNESKNVKWIETNNHFCLSYRDVIIIVRQNCN